MRGKCAGKYWKQEIISRRNLGIWKKQGALSRLFGSPEIPGITESGRAGESFGMFFLFCAFGGKVYKISRDDKGTRLTHMKITGGSLKVKQLLSGEGWEEKADQIRIYDGQSFQTVEEAGEICVCAVTGG